MFQIFRWRREDKNHEKTTSDPLVGHQYKNQHSRHNRGRISRNGRSRPSLLQTRKYWSTIDNDRYQVIIN